MCPFIDGLRFVCVVYLRRKMHVFAATIDNQPKPFVIIFIFVQLTRWLCFSFSLIFLHSRAHRCLWLPFRLFDLFSLECKGVTQSDSSLFHWILVLFSACHVAQKRKCHIASSTTAQSPQYLLKFKSHVGTAGRSAAGSESVQYFNEESAG